jgi:hypothetical protein
MSRYVLRDDSFSDPTFEFVAGTIATDSVNGALQKLKDSSLGGYRMVRVLELRYGIGGEPVRTLDQVAETFNVSKARIRQIEKLALNELAGNPLVGRWAKQADVQTENRPVRFRRCYQPQGIGRRTFRMQAVYEPRNKAGQL